MNSDPERSGEERTESVHDEADPQEELPLPTGTLFFMMIYLMVMAGMWGAIYFEFLGR